MNSTMVHGKEKIRFGFLLTATIKPNITVFSKRNDPQIRERDYCDVLNVLSKTTYPVIFCDSSRYSLKNIEASLSSRPPGTYEVLQFDGGMFPAHLGKGYGELQIIKYALEHSTLLKECDFVVKITGRYFVKNLNEILDTIQREDSTDIVADYDSLSNYTYSGLFVAKPAFFINHLFPLQDFVDDSKKRFFEIALSQAIKNAILDGMTISNFPLRPVITGYSGTWNVKINEKNHQDIKMSFTKIFIIVRGYWKELVKRIQRVFSR